MYFAPHLTVCLRVCTTLAQSAFEDCFRGYFPTVVRSVAGYATKDNREKDRKETPIAAE